MIKYIKAYDIEQNIHNIVESLGLNHVDLTRVICIRSHGSTSSRTIARCHTMSKIIQQALGLEAHYVIEVISERFDRLSSEEKIKTLIHELLHIPKAFGGGFRHHDFVSRKTVDNMYKEYSKLR